uniref:GIY-YIG nuclease family protein n=1 Tax=candidate division CPR3 bacterium TaxID=2268181 RepID=A0A7C4M5I1_UNCC3
MYSKIYSVYIMTNRPRGVLYIGVTSDLAGRVWEHKEGIYKGFTQKYNLKNLIYHEEHEDINEAINREKQLKLWNRNWKIELLEKENPHWDDLYISLA